MARVVRCRGRVFDNIMIERLWRSLKYEEVYPKDYELVEGCEAGLAAYFRLYNEERPHQSLGYRTPLESLTEPFVDCAASAGA